MNILELFKRKPITQFPPADSYFDLFDRFGNPFVDSDFERRYIVSSSHQIADGRWIEIKHHKFITGEIHDVFVDMNDGGLIPILNEYDGAYVVRSIRGSSYPSLHSWGLAIDFDASKYELGSTARLPHQLVECWRKNGFFYGGDFRHRKDPMHFEYSTGAI